MAEAALFNLKPADDMTLLRRSARLIYAARRRRAGHLPSAVFGEPAWDILLDLFASEEGARQIGIYSASLAASVPPSTGSRALSKLVRLGLVERRKDPRDGRRSFVMLTEQGRSGMVAALRSLGGSSFGWRPPEAQISGKIAMT